MNDSHQIKLGYDRDKTETDYHCIHNELAADFQGHDGALWQIAKVMAG